MFIKDKIIDFYLDKSLAYCRIFKIKKAIETVNKALWLDKNNVEALITRGFFYSCLFDKENSFKCYDSAFNKTAKYNVYFQKARACMNLKEFKLALKCFNKVLEYDSENFETLNEIGLCYHYSQNHDKACQYFNNLLKIQPDNVEILINLGDCYLGLGDFDLAMEYVDKALNIDPNNLTGLSTKFEIYDEKGDYSNALKIINRCVEFERNLPSLILKYSLLADLGRYEDSLNGFKEIQTKEFDNWSLVQSYYSNYGYALGLMGKYEDAIKVYDEYLKDYNFPKEEIQEEKEKIVKLISKEDS